MQNLSDTVDPAPDTGNQSDQEIAAAHKVLPLILTVGVANSVQLALVIIANQH